MVWAVAGLTRNLLAKKTCTGKVITVDRPYTNKPVIEGVYEMYHIPFCLILLFF